MSAATVVARANEDATVLGDFRRDAYNTFGRKKARHSDCGAPPITADGYAEDPVALLRSQSFRNNVNRLCVTFPKVHHGLISSLLESTYNDVAKASCLIQQLAETQEPKAQQSRNAKRQQRDWSDQMVDDCPNKTAVSSPFVKASSSPCRRSSDSTPHRVIPEGAHCAPPVFPEETAHTAEPPLSPRSAEDSTVARSSSSCVLTGLSRSPRTAQVSLFPTAAVQSSAADDRAGDDSPRGATLSYGGSPSLQNTVKLLSRVVLSQYDKLTQLQSTEREAREENERLRSELQTTKEDLQRCKEMNRALQYYVSESNRVTTTWGGGGGGGSAGHFFDSHGHGTPGTGGFDAFINRDVF